jgi:hypothetical protein
MSGESIRKCIRAESFLPFEIHLSGGESIGLRIRSWHGLLAAKSMSTIPMKIASPGSLHYT